MRAARLPESFFKLCESVNDRLVLISPFVKQSVIEEVVRRVSKETEIALVTRWNPLEIAAGVNDLEVWDILSSRGRSEVRLLPTIHAKYYRGDETCLVGSANLTRRGLGACENANLELAIRLPAESPGLLEFEAAVLRESTSATDEIANRLRELVGRLPSVALESLRDVEMHDALDVAHPEMRWLPRLRQPDLLFRVYSSTSGSDLSKGSRQSARRDLEALQLPPGLEEEEFDASVASRLISHPVINRVDDFVSIPRRFGEVTDFLHLKEPELRHSDIQHRWQTLMRWLLYFLPHRYEMETPHYSEIFRRLY